jgi:hypothetical protein
MAKRYLLEGEKREGGTGWNVCKYFVLTWTGWMFVVFIASMVQIGQVAQQTTDQNEMSGANGANMSA